MRLLMHVHLPLEPFNAAVSDASAGQKIKRILDADKPGAIYFCEHDRRRGGTLVVNINDASDMPGLAEPWFLTFKLNAEFRVAMTPDDLVRANLGAPGKAAGIAISGCVTLRAALSAGRRSGSHTLGPVGACLRFRTERRRTRTDCGVHSYIFFLLHRNRDVIEIHVRQQAIPIHMGVEVDADGLPLIRQQVLVHVCVLEQTFMTCASLTPELFCIWASCQSFATVSAHEPQ